MKRQKLLAAKKSEIAPKPAPVPASSKKLSNHNSKEKSALKNEEQSSKSDVVSERKEDEAMNKIPIRERSSKNESGGNTKEKKDAMEIDEKIQDGSNDGSDDEAFPEIFDDGPDSDDE